MKEGFFKKRRRLLLVLATAVFTRLIFLFSYHPVWWDSASYIGMAKFLFSNGSVGIFEYTRPLMWPFMLGFLWKLNIDPIIGGRILIFLMSIGVIWLTFLIADKVFNKNTAMIASLILCFTPTEFFFSFRLYNHIPAIFLSLLAVFFYLKIPNQRGIMLAGLVLAFAFQTRFPHGAFLLAFLLFFVLVFLFFNRRNAVIDVFFLSSGFLIGLIPLITFNLLVFHDALFTVKAGAAIIRDSGWVFFQPWYYYFINIPKENVLYIFSLVGIFFIFRNASSKRRNELLIALLALVPLAYFVMLPHKEMRFAISFFPFLAILAAHGFSMLGRFNKKHMLTLLFIIILAFSAYNTFKFYIDNEPKQETQISKEFYRFLKGKDVKGEVLISMPQQALDYDGAPKMMYYPLYNADRVRVLIDYVNESSDKIHYVLLDTGEGGTMCHPDDTQCIELNSEFIGLLDSKFDRVFYQDNTVSKYFIFENKGIEDI